MEIALLKLQSSHKLVREGMVLDAHGWRLQCNGYSRIHSFLLWGFSAQNQNRTCWCSPIPILMRNQPLKTESNASQSLSSKVPRYKLAVLNPNELSPKVIVLWGIKCQASQEVAATVTGPAWGSKSVLARLHQAKQRALHHIPNPNPGQNRSGWRLWCWKQHQRIWLGLEDYLLVASSVTFAKAKDVCYSREFQMFSMDPRHVRITMDSSIHQRTKHQSHHINRNYLQI